MAWLLLLLRTAPSYGYVLRRQLGDRGLEIEAGTLYRTLRELERDDLITSRWMAPAAGPRARVYTITDDGRRQLDRLATAIDDTRALQVAFLDAFRGREPAPAPASTALDAAGGAA